MVHGEEMTVWRRMEGYVDTRLSKGSLYYSLNFSVFEILQNKKS